MPKIKMDQFSTAKKGSGGATVKVAHNPGIDELQVKCKIPTKNVYSFCNYWIEDDSNLWVKMPIDRNILFISGIKSESNGDDVFDFYVNFLETLNLDSQIWSLYPNCAYTITNGSLNITNTGVYLKSFHDPHKYKIESKLYAAFGTYAYIGYQREQIEWLQFGRDAESSGKMYIRGPSSSTSSTASYEWSEHAIYSGYVTVNNKAYLFANDVLKVNGLDFSSNKFTNMLHLNLGHVTHPIKMSINWVRLRKYSPIEPILIPKSLSKSQLLMTLVK